MYIDNEGLTVRIPSAALEVQGVQWTVKNSDVRDPAPLGQVLFAAQGCDLVVLTSSHPVTVRGLPFAAVVVDRGDARARAVVTKRLSQLLPVSARFIEGLTMLTPSRLGPNEVGMLVAHWHARDSLLHGVKRLLDGDPGIQRALLRTDEMQRRLKHDAKVIKTFMANGGGIARQLLQTKERKWRFMDMTLREKPSFAGMTFSLEFDDYDLLEQAETALRTYFKRTGSPVHVKISGFFDRDSIQEHTDMIQATMRMWFRWNNIASRSELAAMLHEICGTSSDDPTSSLPQTDPGFASELPNPFEQAGSGKRFEAA